jgi:phenylpropionate dioxygenase-like ring-hydroxylating dioxygenase large terminal subunit
MSSSIEAYLPMPGEAAAMQENGTQTTGGDLPGLCAALRRAGEAPYDQARALPGDFYADPRILALEREQLFGREWICVGRREEVAAQGDFVAVRILDEPIVIVHGEDGRIRALSNVCRHRGTVIAAGRGNLRRLICPYHHWTYDSAGKLLGAPHMQQRPDFDPARCRLPEFACCEWQGFLFVSLAAEPRPLAPRLAPLEEMVRPYHLERMAVRYAAEEVWETNWKCLLENFMEGYHLSSLHRETLHKVNPTKLCRHFPAGEGYFGYYAGFSPDLPRSQKGHPELSNQQLDDCVMFAVPPGFAVGCASDYSSFICIQPETVHRVRVKLGLIFYGSDWPQNTVDWAVDLFQRTMAEDKVVLVSLAQGLRSRHYRPGPLGPADYEGPIRDFYGYLCRTMGPALAALATTRAS